MIKNTQIEHPLALLNRIREATMTLKRAQSLISGIFVAYLLKHSMKILHENAKFEYTGTKKL